MSRRDRKRQNQNNRNTSGGDISNVYYIVIGLLFVILIGLIIFIFSRSGEDVNLDNNDDSTEQVEQNDETTDSEEPGADETEEPETPPADDETDQEETPEDNSADADDTANEDDTEETETANNSETDAADAEVGETITVNTNAPHDPSHAVDYNGGSADRVEIKNRVMEVTGLDSSLIEWWIGNDGPGRVKATVSNNDSTIYYDVYLQYGEGSWHVTRYQRVSGS